MTNPGAFSIRKYHPLRVHVRSTRLYFRNQIIFWTAVYVLQTSPPYYNRIDSTHLGVYKIMSGNNVITYYLNGACIVLDVYTYITYV